MKKSAASGQEVEQSHSRETLGQLQGECSVGDASQRRCVEEAVDADELHQSKVGVHEGSCAEPSLLCWFASTDGSRVHDTTAKDLTKEDQWSDVWWGCNRLDERDAYEVNGETLTKSAGVIHPSSTSPLGWPPSCGSG